MNEAVRVWRVSLLVSEKQVAEYAQCLSEDEQSRASRFRFEADRRKFVVARGVLRHLLSKQLGCSAIAITFDYGKHGKPETTVPIEGSTPFHFNLSHSGELALCALGGDCPVGVDIEKVKSIQRIDGMIKRCLVDAEKAQVFSLPSDQQVRAFLQYWTCKEAYLKAIGLGLAQPMTSVEVDLTAPRLVSTPEDCLEGWRLHRLALSEDYVGALVVAGEPTVEINCWQHPNH